MEYMLAKMLLPLLIPMITMLLKQFIDKATPLALEKIPKPMWTAVAVALGVIPTLVSPDLFVIPGLPSSVSMAFYGLAAMGAREIVDQSVKVIGPAPAGTLQVPTA